MRLEVAMHLTVTSSSQPEQPVVIEAERSRRCVLLVLALLPEIERVARGKVVLSWGESGSVKWSVESHGDDLTPT